MSFARWARHPNGRRKRLASRRNRITVDVYDGDLTAEDQAANSFLYHSTDTSRVRSGRRSFPISGSSSPSTVEARPTAGIDREGCRSPGLRIACSLALPL